MSRTTIAAVVGLVGILISSCSGAGGQEMRDDPAGLAGTPQIQTTTAIPEPTNTPEPTITSTPTITPTVILPPEPLVVDFEAEDGESLSGIYYPADQNPAPIMVLMNWAKGDQEDWKSVAVWLQNRTAVDQTPDYNRSWRSANWYPENTRDGTIGVFTFNFRQCEGGCKAYLPAEWYLDAKAAVATASELTGADKERILTLGASIGADGAVDGCAWLNHNSMGTCLGAFAFSPGSFLTIPFDEQAEFLLQDNPNIPLYCVYGLRDDAAVETCSGLPGVIQIDYGYIENHGMELIQPQQRPDPLILIQEFIDLALSVNRESEK